MKTNIQSIADLTPEKLLASGNHRLTLQARLAPTAGRDRFQPAGFPEIGHVIYDSPQPFLETVEKEIDGKKEKLIQQRKDETGQPLWQKHKVCIVDSAASMANHLETVCHSGPFGMELHPDLKELPYVVCVTDDDKGGKSRVVVTTLSEGHRLASSYFANFKGKGKKRQQVAFLMDDDTATDDLFGDILRSEFGIIDLDSKSHPLPDDWWNVFLTIFKYDPNSLVHGILFPSLGIKIPRTLSAQMDALGAARVVSSGVKFDKLGKTTSGQPIFPKDEETAEEILATFVIDLALIQSFGNGEKGLNDARKQFLIVFALWKVIKLLQNPFRFRSGCDLEFQGISINGSESSDELPDIKIAKYIESANFNDLKSEPVTKVYWPSSSLFTDDSGDDDEAQGEAEESEQDS